MIDPDHLHSEAFNPKKYTRPSVHIPAVVNNVTHPPLRAIEVLSVIQLIILSVLLVRALWA